MAKMKLKTHSGAKKRFKLTKNGKIKRGHAFRSHILTKKTTSVSSATCGSAASTTQFVLWA